MVERCFATEGEYNVVDGEKAATVGAFGSSLAADKVWLLSLCGEDMCSSQGVSVYELAF